uniref:Secretory carrier-associated membrane protein n=1 Tax=Macrostomum lignano TaxID=282301 RepID=A0A1I8ITC4_9PLAT
RQNNWPPLPAFSPVGPCFYQDIDVDIPSEFRSLVRLSYYLWLAHVCLLLVNILGTLAYFIGVQAGKTNAGTVFGVSLIVCVAFVPASYVCWFRPLYKAFKNDSSFNFFLFFVMFFVQFGILAIQCLGLDYLGSCGWINAFVMMKQSTAVGMFMLLIALCFTALAGLDMALLVRVRPRLLIEHSTFSCTLSSPHSLSEQPALPALQVHRIYRSTGASFAKARQEFSQGVLANEAVRGAAADAAAVSARSAFTGGGSGGGGGRY